MMTPFGIWGGDHVSKIAVALITVGTKLLGGAAGTVIEINSNQQRQKKSYISQMATTI
jgi:hypothetical protein